MRIAVFSDIHGNESAFFNAIKSVEQKNIEHIYICGDICGYYFGHNQIIDYLRNNPNIKCIMGNHDKLCLDLIDGIEDIKNVNSLYSYSFKNILSTISEENKQYLRSLKNQITLNIDNIKIGIYHANPFDYMYEYFYPDSDFTSYNELDYDYIFQGHTHYRMKKTVDNLTIINPGAIGQPRDGLPPSYVLFDTNSKTIEYVDVNYDIMAYIKMLEGKYNLSDCYVTTVLQRSIKD